MIKDEALFALKRHPLQLLFEKIISTSQKERKHLLDSFDDAFHLSSIVGKRAIFELIEHLYFHGNEWEQRYASLDMLKSMAFYDLYEFDADSLKRIDKLIVSALCDDDGRVRKNGFYAVSIRRFLETPFDLFFLLYEAAQQHSGKKQHNLCRALLEIVSSITDEDMLDAGLFREYKKVIQFAINVTGYDPSYYLATPTEKIRMNIEGRRWLMRKRTKEMHRGT